VVGAYAMHAVETFWHTKAAQADCTSVHSLHICAIVPLVYQSMCNLSQAKEEHKFYCLL